MYSLFEYIANVATCRRFVMGYGEYRPVKTFRPCLQPGIILYNLFISLKISIFISY